jgi:hypothetical protein
MSYKSTLNQTDQYHIYLDLAMINNDTRGTEPPVKVRFDEIRNSPILDNCSEWFCSVVRFYLETPSLPLFIPQIELGQSNPDKTIYQVCLTYTYNNVVYEFNQPIFHVAQDKSQPVANPPLLEQDMTYSSTGQYYFIYSFTHWINMVNTALQGAFNGLKTAVQGAGGTLPTNNAPFFEWDPDNSTAILNADKAGYDQKGLANPILFYMNSPLYTLFSSLQADHKGYRGITNGKNFLIDIYNNNNTNILNLPNNLDLLQMYQEYSTAPLLNPVKSVSFGTGIIPVEPTLTSVPKIFNSDSKLQNSGNNSNFNTVITDFEVPYILGTESKPCINYNASAEYRLLDMFSNSPLNNIQITIMWSDRFGNLYDFFLDSGACCRIKLMFRKKTFNVSK